MHEGIMSELILKDAVQCDSVADLIWSMYSQRVKSIIMPHIEQNEINSDNLSDCNKKSIVYFLMSGIPFLADLQYNRYDAFVRHKGWYVINNKIHCETYNMVLFSY